MLISSDGQSFSRNTGNEQKDSLKNDLRPLLSATNLAKLSKRYLQRLVSYLKFGLCNLYLIPLLLMMYTVY